MKQGIHPEYQLTTIVCACGATYTVRSTKQIKRLEICSSCHPFFTGKSKLIDTAGRVDKFNQRFQKFDPAKAAEERAAKQAKAAEAAKKAAEELAEKQARAKGKGKKKDAKADAAKDAKPAAPSA